jgi:eukaryotic-like serine/threonine-protein kinase
VNEEGPRPSETRTAATPPGSAPPPSPFLKPGTTLDHFEIVERLGSGGFGDVYRARDTRLGRMVAIKILPDEFAQDTARRERFRLEATAASALNHPHICTIHDFVEAQGRHLIVMELVEGRTLHDVLRAGPLPAAKAIDLAAQLASALAEAHAAGILHRDIKSTNIVVSSRGQAKILDFGIAKRIGAANTGGADTPALTQSGMTLGTLTHMSPEQLLGKPIDARSDLFSLGVVVYEMVTGRLPFAGSNPVAVSNALLHDLPRGFGDAPVPERLKATILKLLEKDRDKRHPSAEALQTELASMVEPADPAAAGRVPLRRSWIAAAGILVLALAAAAGWLWHRSSRARWVRTTAIPEIGRLVAAEDFHKATALIREARSVQPADPTLEKLSLQSTMGFEIDSEPPGAEVSYRPYGGDPHSWTSAGRTPVKSLRLAKDFYLWRAEKAGFLSAYHIDPYWSYFTRPSYNVVLHLEPSPGAPPDMVPVIGGRFTPPGPLVDNPPRLALPDFLIDRHEVTNEEFKRFVDAGGYRKPEYWREPFTRGGRTIPFEEAMALFPDATGRPGPATWELGSFPTGLEKNPVAGVSWYECAAYAAFAGKTLPTIHHWRQAAQIAATRLISPAGNFRGTGTLPAGDGRISGFGTTDMAGNVKEWCANDSSDGRRFIMGGGFGEPTYMFADQDAQQPWDRRPNYGFRCVKLLSPLPPEAMAAVALRRDFRDFLKEKPASDELFRAYVGLYAYDKGPLNARVEQTTDSEDWRLEKVSFDAAYGGERVIAYLFLPKNSPPPYQTVVFFPGSNAFAGEKFTSIPPYAEFIPRSGRALLAPIYKSTFERGDDLKNDDPVPTAFFRDHVIDWAKDLRRSVDYVETRPDLRHDALAYLGLSWGAAVAPVMLSVENRFKVAVLLGGGLEFARALPEADQINFIGHVRTPVLLLNGRHDHFFPVETSQKPFVKLLGTPEADKKSVLYETGHAPPRKEVIRESLDWLDKYLGPVKR